MKALLAKCAVYAAIAIAPMPGKAHAYSYFEDGNGLFEECSAPERDQLYFQKTARCTAYITGVYDSVNWFRATMDSPKCEISPSGVTRGQVRDVVFKYMSDHPETRHEPAIQIVVVALNEAFCAKE